MSERNLKECFLESFLQTLQNITYATTDLYAAIENESILPWLDVFVPTQQQLIAPGKTEEAAAIFQSYVQALRLHDMQGSMIRSYFVKKLKGKVS